MTLIKVFKILTWEALKKKNKSYQLTKRKLGDTLFIIFAAKMIKYVCLKCFFVTFYKIINTNNKSYDILPHQTSFIIVFINFLCKRCFFLKYINKDGEAKLLQSITHRYRNKNVSVAS
jgi:hypothetical protein